jgi:hypothetical protein
MMPVSNVVWENPAGRKSSSSRKLSYVRPLARSTTAPRSPNPSFE